MPLGMAKEPTFDVERLPGRAELVERYAAAIGPRHQPRIGWYDVFARWKLAIVLEGSYAKFLRGQSDKPIHEFFGIAGRPAARQRREHRSSTEYGMSRPA